MTYEPLWQQRGKWLTSRQNPLIKHWHALAHHSKVRKKSRQTLLDGAHLLHEALRHAWPLQGVMVSEQGCATTEIQQLLVQLPAQCPLFFVNDGLFAQLSPVEAASGVLTLIDYAVLNDNPPVNVSMVVLDGVQEPGNVGAIIRSAAAAGIQQIFLTPGCAHAWSPRVLRAAMGGHFLLKIYDNIDIVALLRNCPHHILATSLEASVSVFECDLRQPVVWLLGSEGAGLSDQLCTLATQHIHIPMPGAMESLNVAASAAICFFEQVRQQMTTDGSKS